MENPEDVFNAFRDESILNEERAKSIEGRLDYISGAIKKLEVAKKRITEAFKAEVMTLPELRKEKTDIELSEEKLISERDALIMKLNVQHDVSAKIDLFKETCHKFLSKINDPKIVTERLKKDIIKLVIDEVVIEGESVKIFATIPLPNKIHEREMDKTDIPGTFNAGATLGPVNETNMARIWNKHKQTNTPLKKKVFVGMSGGVDSSVSAALLARTGYDVTGVFIKVWQPDWMECTWREDRLDAMRVCVELGIPFVTLDLEKEYKREVVDYMISEYKAGRTPNPDVMCNQHVKFGGFFDWAMEQDADYVATGHYAQIKEENGTFRLIAGTDRGKDQTYFLWTLTERELSKTLFPVGNLEKSETRELARKWNLPVAEKKDSQGLCFIGKVNIKEFLSHYIGPKKGSVLDEKGKIIGEHDGAVFLTIGERHGFRITTKTSDDKPYYIIARNIVKNTVTVSHKSLNGNLSVEKREYSFDSPNWISNMPETGREYTARIRHLGDLLSCKLEIIAKNVKIIFEKPIIVASGQSVVIYDKGECLGGGIVI